jgi:putative tricarboxylic transport membrane protein
MYLGAIVGLIGVPTSVPWRAAILRIPFAAIVPVIIVIDAIGAYTVHSSMWRRWSWSASWGGDVVKTLKYPPAPLALGGMAQASFRPSMLIPQGSLAIFRAKPQVGSLTCLALPMLAWPLIGRVQGAMRSAQARRFRMGEGR